MKNKPRLLFISPIAPQLTGNGLAMRAGTMLEALSQDFKVSLLVVPISGNPGDHVNSDLEACCSEVAKLEHGDLGNLFTRACHHPLLWPLLGWLHRYPVEWRAITSRTIQKSYAIFKGRSFDRIHIFRTYMIPFARPYILAGTTTPSQVHLDMDDIESQTRTRLAELQPEGAKRKRLKQEAADFENREQQCLSFCDHIYVCSKVDRQILSRRFPGYQNFHTVPNIIRLPETAAEKKVQSPFCFLFIANLAYPPNQDGLNWFIQAVLPILKKTAPGPFKVILAGSGEWKGSIPLKSLPEFEVKGFVQDLEALYNSCDASIAPIRVGGGTRIKILESLAHKRPIITTSSGAEGLELESEILLGDTAPLFAAACCRIMEDASLRKRLVDDGYKTVSSCYSPEVLLKTLREMKDKQISQ